MSIITLTDGFDPASPAHSVEIIASEHSISIQQRPSDSNPEFPIEVRIEVWNQHLRVLIWTASKLMNEPLIIDLDKPSTQYP